MDAEQLDFPDAVFDRLLCGFGIMFFPNRDRALGEFRRVLKPGGQLGVSTWRVSQGDDVEAVFAELGLDRPRRPGWITEPDELKRLLGEAGFTNVLVVVDSATFRYTDMEEYWQTVRGTGFRGALDGLDAVQGERVRAALAERLRGQQGPDGIHIVATALLAVAAR
jgi:SAM-dependent methyltransferase